MNIISAAPEIERTARRTGLSCTTMSSPVGELVLVSDASHLCGLYFAGCAHVPSRRANWNSCSDHPVLCDAKRQLQEYFNRDRRSFSVPIRWSGTEFQQRIWSSIAVIPFGETLTYTRLAETAGAPHAIRAVGTATGRNPVSIIVPCHRVVGKDGRLCGFAGGLERKQFLLRLERESPAMDAFGG